MRKVEATEKQIMQAFTEWERRYRADPEKFISEARKLLSETPSTYGESCASYFIEILEETKRKEV